VPLDESGRRLDEASARRVPFAWGWRAPGGPPALVRVSGDAFSTAVVAVDLDPSRDVTPVRPPSVPPAPAPVREDPSGLWRVALLAVAGLLLVADLLLVRAARRKVAGVPSPA
jgi:hypothetical protein